MQLRSKKIIAREFLLLVLLLLLTGGVYLSIFTYRIYHEAKVDLLQSELNDLWSHKKTYTFSEYHKSSEKERKEQAALIKAIDHKNNEILEAQSGLPYPEGLTLQIALYFLILLYPLRFLYYALSWSIRTIQQPDLK